MGIAIALGILAIFWVVGEVHERRHADSSAAITAPATAPDRAPAAANLPADRG